MPSTKNFMDSFYGNAIFFARGIFIGRPWHCNDRRMFKIGYRNGVVDFYFEFSTKPTLQEPLLPKIHGKYLLTTKQGIAQRNKLIADIKIASGNEHKFASCSFKRCRKKRFVKARSKDVVIE